MDQENELLKIKELKKSFGSSLILNGVNLSIQKGEVLVILGPSGCGKSTLLRCINGLEGIDSGEILFHGTNIHGKEIKVEQIRQKIGMVFQSYDLFSHMTVIDNILLGPLKVQNREKEEVLKSARELLLKVGLSEKENSYPRELSGGQKQRAAIVRSLCMQPEMILFDEVTAALDPEMVREVLDVILALATQGMTMMIVTHELNFARSVADRIIFMDEGNILEESVPDKFFAYPQTERARQFLNKFEFERHLK